ncbi:MAG TPA: fumarylacetoacetate hydrolase family protein, partial [Gemmataceae bacterium]|nr:fumarylacetoacetate hydrolase family protein [Gemmataceae bacterium]
MKIIRFEDATGEIHYAAERAEGGYVRIEGQPFGKHSLTQQVADVRKILAPVAPVAIWCIGQNYRAHAAEVGMSAGEYPVAFIKSVNTVQHPGDPILIPSHAGTNELDYEGELVVVIGKACKDVSRERSLDYVAGYTCGNDVSARDWQLKKGGTQWCRGKSFDSFAPIGPCLVTPDEIPNPNALRIQTIVNGRTMQDGNTADMIRDVPALIEFLSQSTT